MVLCVHAHVHAFGLLNVYPIFDSQSEHVSAIWPWEWNREMETDRLWKKTVWFLHRKSNHQSIWVISKDECTFYECTGYFTDFSLIFAVLSIIGLTFFFFFLGRTLKNAWLFKPALFTPLRRGQEKCEVGRIMASNAVPFDFVNSQSNTLWVFYNSEIVNFYVCSSQNIFCSG